MKICFVAGNTYPLLSNDFSSQIIGGAERQQVFIATALRDLGYNVCFIVEDYGQRDGELVGGFKAYKTFNRDEGLPILRYYYIKLPRIWRALRRADADVYYTRGAGFMPAVLAAFCKKYNKKFIFAGAHESDFIPGMHIVPTIRDRLMYRYGLRKADLIILQTRKQRELLRRNMGLDGVVIRSLSPYGRKELSQASRQHVLWVSTIRSWKRPEFFVRLAKKFPDQKFVLIGGAVNGERSLYDKIRAESRRIHNIEFLGFRPYEETEKYFDKAKIFVNTSTAEGFPNTFLQAWRRGIPVLSFVDPDGLIQGYNLGTVVSSEKDLEVGLRELLRNYEGFQEHIHEVYDKEFSAESIIAQYDKVLKELAR